MSSTTERRKEYNYREKYLERNKGTFFTGRYVCAICHKSIGEVDMEVDHIIPLSKFGPNHVINCVATCRDCNRSKSDSMNTTILLEEILWKILEEIIIGTKWIIKSLYRIISSIIKYPLEVAETSRGKFLIYILYIIVIYVVLCEMGVLKCF